MVTAAELQAALAALHRGELVAFPTETVYGLGADASNEQAVRRIFAAKGRPADHPVIVHLPEGAALEEWAAVVSPAALRLSKRFWPGPLTMILPKAPHVLDVVTGGQQSVGLRIPDHPVAQGLLRAFADGTARGLAAPSANRFGRVSPTRAEHVRAELGTTVALVLDGGPARVGLESTIVDLTGERPALLRPGHISAAEIAEVLGEPPLPPSASSPRAPGTLASHYAPSTPVQLAPAQELLSVVDELSRQLRVAVLARRPAPRAFGDVPWIELPSHVEGFARGLYAALRELDAHGCERIVVEEVPEDDAWLAVRDRLRRAAHSATSDAAN